MTSSPWPLYPRPHLTRRHRGFLDTSQRYLLPPLPSAHTHQHISHFLTVLMLNMTRDIMDIGTEVRVCRGRRKAVVGHITRTTESFYYVKPSISKNTRIFGMLPSEFRVAKDNVVEVRKISDLPFIINRDRQKDLDTKEVQLELLLSIVVDTIDRHDLDIVLFIQSLSRRLVADATSP